MAVLLNQRGKPFRQHICRHPLRVDVLHGDGTLLDVLAKEVVLDIDVLRATVAVWVLYSERCSPGCPEYRTVGEWSLWPKPRSQARHQTASFAASAEDMYSASTVDWAVVPCRVDSQLTTAPPR